MLWIVDMAKITVGSSLESAIAYIQSASPPRDGKGRGQKQDSADTGDNELGD